MRKTWKKAMAGTMAAAVMFTSANISPAVMNAEAKMFNLKETPTDTTKGTIDWFANDATSNIRTKMTVQYGGTGSNGNAVYYDNSAVGSTAVNYDRVFDRDYNTAILFRQAHVDGNDYIQLDFQSPISLSKVKFSLGTGCYYHNAKIQYLTDGDSEWKSFNDDWVEAVTEAETSSCCYEYESEEPKEHITAIRLQNKEAWTTGNAWIVVQEIEVIGTSEVTVGKDYPVSLMTYTAGSAQTNEENKEGPVDYAFDGNTATYWHSEWENDNNSKYSLSDAWIAMEFEKATVIDQLTYLPRPADATAGDILAYKIEGKTSENGAWENIMTGTWAADKEEKTAEFPEPKRLTAVRLVPTETNNSTEDGKNLYASAAKIAVRVGSEAKIAGSALSLTGKIGVNFYAQVVDDKKDNAQIKISYNGKNTTYSVSDLTKTTLNGKEYYIVTQKVCAAEMNDDITATLMVDGEVVDEQTQSVAKYAKTVIDNEANYSDKPDLVALVKAMVNYGAYAQTNFEYRADDLANKFLDAADINVESVDVADITAPVASRDKINEKYPVEQLKLALESGTSLKFYLNDECFAEGIDGYSFTVAKSGNEATDAEVLTSSSGKYVEYADIPAAELDDSYVLKISKDGIEVATVTYSPLNGVVSTLKTSSLSDNLKNTMKALYLYNQAADAYFASIEQ